jgi:DNA-binding response OmpR family regulator
MKILVVDDKQAILNSLGAALTAHGYDVDTACNGLDASEKSQNEVYDLLIIDHLMPIMNGIQLVKNLRMNEQYHSTPIIFMTTQGQNSVQSEYKNGLFSDLIDKPINEEKLLILIGNYQNSNTHSQSL